MARPAGLRLHRAMTLSAGYALLAWRLSTSWTWARGVDCRSSVTGPSSPTRPTSARCSRAWSPTADHLVRTSTISEDEAGRGPATASCSYRVGDLRGTLAPGGTSWFPRWVPHAVAALSGGPCRFLTVVDARRRHR